MCLWSYCKKPYRFCIIYLEQQLAVSNVLVHASFLVCPRRGRQHGDSMLNMRKSAPNHNSCLHHHIHVSIRYNVEKVNKKVHNAAQSNCIDSKNIVGILFLSSPRYISSLRCNSIRNAFQLQHNALFRHIQTRISHNPRPRLSLLLTCLEKNNSEGSGRNDRQSSSHRFVFVFVKVVVRVKSLSDAGTTWYKVGLLYRSYRRHAVLLRQFYRCHSVDAPRSNTTTTSSTTTSTASWPVCLGRRSRPSPNANVNAKPRR